MTVIGLDPGSKFGWAVLYTPEFVETGWWDLAPAKLRGQEGGGVKYLRLDTRLRALIEQTEPVLVCYELVRGHKGPHAAHMYGGWQSHLMAVCEDLDVPYTGVEVSDVKKCATGKGNASKSAVVKAVKERVPGWSGTEDEADAYWIAQAGYEREFGSGAQESE